MFGGFGVIFWLYSLLKDYEGARALLLTLLEKHGY